MSLNPIIALDHVIEEYRDHLQSESDMSARLIGEPRSTAVFGVQAGHCFGLSCIVRKD
jgi:hypothetical protein